MNGLADDDSSGTDAAAGAGAGGGAPLLVADAGFAVVDGWLAMSCDHEFVGGNCSTQGAQAAAAENVQRHSLAKNTCTIELLFPTTHTVRGLGLEHCPF